jgi:hypothetical protein
MAMYVVQIKDGRYLGHGCMVRSLEKARVFTAKYRIPFVVDGTIIEVRLALVREVKPK